MAREKNNYCPECYSDSPIYFELKPKFRITCECGYSGKPLEITPSKRTSVLSGLKKSLRTVR